MEDNQFYRQVSYGEHPRQVVSFYDRIPAFVDSLNLPPLIFIHGGAWKDPTNTDRDVDKIAEFLNKTIPFCSIDYRLSSEVKHPAFLEDVLAASELVTKHLASTTISLIGHSVGATLCLQAINALPPNITVEKVYLLDGIYDLPELLKEYPDYRSFVDEAHDDYTSVEIPLDKLKDVEVHIVQSYEDELLSMSQTNWLVKQLQDLNIPYQLKVANLGKHNDVYTNTKLADYLNTTYFQPR